MADAVEAADAVPDAPGVREVMNARRSAFDRMADVSGTSSPGKPFANLRIDARAYAADGTGEDASHPVPSALVRAVTDRLARDGGFDGPGAALVTGLPTGGNVLRARQEHERLFRAVWADFLARTGQRDPAAGYAVKTKTTTDGVIPPELYGSNWSFKRPHADRDAWLFSHRYGPVAGCGGGAPVLLDVRRYLRRHGLRFADAFEWSREPTPGSKPVLRAEHHEAAMAECGVVLEGVGLDAVLFVNNLPDAGVLHGATPVRVTDPDLFVREYHRCSVKDARPC
ncbi:hypothetical protein [Streptomyces sp. NPDC087300]|uniref:hypothetical protein n=1 Tax=Streptomyces sp. NPDC087300 TaxID=3365780 RepID=UPI00382FF279